MQNLEPESVENPSGPSYVVGVGASAGGLQSLEEFFENVSSQTKMAFVVVQHLSPNFKTMMDELLARKTDLAIELVDSDRPVKPGVVYLLAPRKQMIIANGMLHVTEKDTTEGFNLPIDHFFRSLGQDQRERSIGVILSGTGSDGSRGIEHIHREGGLILAQSEETTAFDGMTRSACNTGLVDVVCAAQKMPPLLERYATSPKAWRENSSGRSGESESGDGITQILSLLRENHGMDFRQYKESMIARRIERRLLIRESFDLESYVEELKTSPDELLTLYRDMLIGVTGFFRDPGAYKKLETELIPELMENLGPDQDFRVWVAATATGEEAYSIAILVDEYFSKHNRPIRCRIFATDVDQRSLEIAGHGLYSEAKVRDLSSERLKRYFDKEPGGYRIKPEIRRTVVFAPHNVISDAPFTNLNLITCRNLFIYLRPEVQSRILTLFHFGLTVGGGLWLGSSEFPADLVDEFDQIDSKWKMYRKRRDIRLKSRLRVTGSGLETKPRANAESKAKPFSSSLLKTYDTLLEVYMPPAMLVTASRQLLQTFGGASRFIEPTDGRVSTDVADQLSPSLRIPFTTAVGKATRQSEIVDFDGIAFETDGVSNLLGITVRPFDDQNSDEPLFIVEFRLDESTRLALPTREKIDAERSSNEHIQTLERELAFARQTLNATIEELQSANEEMQSTNEELVASNEELQSTNEELHSVNEELYTVNAEFQRKISELTEMTDDMDNLLNSTHVDTIFLDRELKVRKFTPDVAQKFNLMRQDIGRDFESFTYRLDDDNLADELKQVLRTERPFEREVRDRNSYVYLMRILPYVSRGKVEGVVLTLIDITRLNEAQTKLAELSEIVEQSADAIFRVDRDRIIRTWNTGAKRLYGRDDEIIGTPLRNVLPASLRPSLDGIFANLVKTGEMQRIETHQISVDNKIIDVSVTLSPVYGERGKMVAASVIARDVTDRLRADRKIQESIVRRDEFLAMLSHELRNPLGAIVNAARLLQGNKELATREQGASDVIVRQSEQMSRLLDDLLDVSRITLGKIELRKEVLDMTHVIEEAVRVMGPAFDDSGVDFKLELDPTELSVEGDPARLQQAIVNLLRNAAKYTPPGGSVTMQAFRGRDQVEIRIRDTGLGIAEEMQESIFEMFVQVHSSLERSQGGIGLGLTLVKAVVSMHDGEIEVFSEGHGKGSEFRISLPLSMASMAEHGEDLPVITARTIVVVEDIPDARNMLRDLLIMQGYQVDSAGDGIEGLEMVREIKPDVSLIDIGLPKMDGYEVARQLRLDPSTKDLFLVALTGYGQSSDREKVTAAGFDAHLVKPLHANALDEVLRQKSKTVPT